MTPEQREELKTAAQEKIRAKTESVNDYFTISQAFDDLATPEAVLSLIAQVEALTRKEKALQGLADERYAEVLELTAQLSEALTVPQWISVEDRLPAPGVLVMVWQPRQEWNYPDDLLISFDCIDPDDDDAGTWRGHNRWYEEYCIIGKPEGSTGPSQDAPYTHWKPMDAAPTIPAIPGTKEDA